jgi:hypothetical protein
MADHKAEVPVLALILKITSSHNSVLILCFVTGPNLTTLAPFAKLVTSPFSPNLNWQVGAGFLTLEGTNPLPRLPRPAKEAAAQFGLTYTDQLAILS